MAAKSKPRSKPHRFVNNPKGVVSVDTEDYVYIKSNMCMSQIIHIWKRSVFTTNSFMFNSVHYSLEKMTLKGLGSVMMSKDGLVTQINSKPHLKYTKSASLVHHRSRLYCGNSSNSLMNSWKRAFVHTGKRSISTDEDKKGIQQNISSLQAKKRPPKKKTSEKEVNQKKFSSTYEIPYVDEIFSCNIVDLSMPKRQQKHWIVVAYSTAEEYDINSLSAALKKQGLYEELSMPEDIDDVIHLSAKYQVEEETREIYFFREGCIVLWNIPEVEQQAVLKFLKPYESNSYDEHLVDEEKEDIKYFYDENRTRLINGTILLNCAGATNLEKYTFSNGMALSVKLALWEASLDSYAESIEWITENMKTGKKIPMSRDQVFRKTGELFALRHLINLSSDLLDTPDFYWDRQDLENLYLKTCNHLNITKRTKVMNEKLNHCCELMDLLSNHLNDRHHVRLELMIIALIMVEVVFEFIHYTERVF